MFAESISITPYTINKISNPHVYHYAWKDFWRVDIIKVYIQFGSSRQWCISINRNQKAKKTLPNSKTKQNHHISTHLFLLMQTISSCVSRVVSLPFILSSVYLNFLEKYINPCSLNHHLFIDWSHIYSHLSSEVPCVQQPVPLFQ